MRLASVGRLIGAALSIVLVAGAASASPDELYYAASNCQPFDGASWHGGGGTGFRFEPATGGLYNYHSTSVRALVCPVPYDRVSPPARVVARVVVDDRHGLAFTRAWLCGRGTTSGKICDSRDNFPTVFGVSTIELSIQPTDATRFVWLEIEVPDNDDDGNPFSLNGVSGVLGYRIFRD
jgi:hypothetical protein